ncbi:hypothetical protein [Methylomonas rapida]|uniref:Uncharacterized protein n=1 Tax=Methylomonas rapida TaxID=2963939 RepID=A0ABY7GJH3_9GAMM|nr:hypothetical protein [Methylomonas rapida]WAR44635.1 hypothetical protein NM686_020165 [Methylomonas rapida]
MREQNNSARLIGTHLTSLGLLPEVQPQDVVTELTLSVDRLLRQHSELMVFAKDASRLAAAITNQEFIYGASILETIYKRHGYSYWAVETEIALMHASSGLDTVKSKINRMSIGTTGLNKFFLYYIGMRNEPAQTTSRYKANLKRKIDESNFSDQLRTYSKYRLYGALEIDQVKLAHVLAYDQLTTTVDLLFTVIKVTRIILGQQFAFSNYIINAAKETLNTLAPIISALGITAYGQDDSWESELPPKGQSASSLAHIAHNSIQACLNLYEEPLSTENNYETLVINGLASILSTRSDKVIAEELAKTLLNFSWLPLAIELGEITSVPSLPDVFVTVFLTQHAKKPKIYTIYDALISIVDSLLTGSSFNSNKELQQLIIRIRELQSTDKVITTELQLGQVANDIQQVILAHFFYENGDIPSCLNICAEAGMNNDQLIPLLPLAKLFQGVKWATLRRCADSIDLSIALDHYLRIIDDRKSKTHKRYAVEELLKLHKCKTIVDMPEALVNAGVEKDKIEFLCYYVCDIVTLELLPDMSNSRTVFNTRREVLSQLAALHTDRELSYLREVEHIEDDLQVNDGLSVLDDSKVYVDEQAVLNFISKEMFADFQRYLKIVETGVGTSESINELLKSFNNPSARTFQIPKNDADDLLTEILRAILDRFLFDPASGLDIIIGRRIRHGTISSEIRGVLEAADLIGHKPRIGAAYLPPARVTDICAKFDPKHRRIVIAAFGRFSESIDQLIALLRDEYFYVRSKEKTRGIFDLQLTPVIFAIARSVAQKCDSIDQFAKECFELFWYYLSIRLETLRPNIEVETKKTLNSIFHKLTNELRAISAVDAVFFAQLQQISDELQRRASMIAGWIRIPNASIESNSYTMQQVMDVAVAVIAGQRPGFRPIFTSNLPDSLKLDTHGFSIVSDALYIAFDNT